MTDITPEQIAKLAKWAGLKGVRVQKNHVFHEIRYGGMRIFDPINDHADAWLLLEKLWRDELEVTLSHAGHGLELVPRGMPSFDVTADNPRAALCLAILEMLE